MKNSQAIITPIICLWLSACSIAESKLVHHIDVQQGNVITQDTVNQLKPGMSRHQIQYIMGTPMVVDVFHQNRWDYFYVDIPGRGKITRKHDTLLFDNDALTRISGTVAPQPEAAAAESASKQVTLVVPSKVRVPPGLLNRFWYWITFRDIDATGN